MKLSQLPRPRTANNSKAISPRDPGTPGRIQLVIPSPRPMHKEIDDDLMEFSLEDYQSPMTTELVCV